MAGTGRQNRQVNATCQCHRVRLEGRAAARAAGPAGTVPRAGRRNSEVTVFGPGLRRLGPAGGSNLKLTRGPSPPGGRAMFNLKLASVTVTVPVLRVRLGPSQSPASL